MTRSVLTALILFVNVATSFAGKQDFNLVNKTGFDIHEVYVSPHSSGEWAEDVMGKGILADGQSVKISFSRNEAAKEWDLKVVDKDGKATVWESLDLLSIAKVTLRFKDLKATADVE